MIDELDKETFICFRCKGEFTAVDGTWPHNTISGEPIYTRDANDDETNESPTNFYCYDCVDL